MADLCYNSALLPSTGILSNDTVTHWIHYIICTKKTPTTQSYLSDTGENALVSTERCLNIRRQKWKAAPLARKNYFSFFPNP